MLELADFFLKSLFPARHSSRFLLNEINPTMSWEREGGADICTLLIGPVHF